MRSVHFSCGVASGDRVLEQVRERAVPEVVQERRGEGLARAFGGDSLRLRQRAVDRAQPREQELHHERRSDGVREARVLGPRKCERGHPELPDPPQPLQLGRVDEQLDDALLVALEGDEAVHGITKNHDRAPRPSLPRGRRRTTRAPRRGPGARRGRLARRRTRPRAGGPLGVPRDAKRPVGAVRADRRPTPAARAGSCSSTRTDAPRRSTEQPISALPADGRCASRPLRRGARALLHEQRQRRPGAAAPAPLRWQAATRRPGRSAARAPARSRRSCRCPRTDRPPGPPAATRTPRSGRARARGFCVGYPVRSAADVCRSGATSVHSASTRRSRHQRPAASFTRKYFTYTLPLAVRCTRPSFSRRAMDSSV